MKSLSKLTPKFFYLRIQIVLELSARLLSLLFYIGAYIFLDNFFDSNMPVFAGVLSVIIVFIVSTLVYYFMRHMISIIFFYLFVYCIAFILVMTGNDPYGAILPVLICLITMSAISSLSACKKNYPRYVYTFKLIYYIVPVAMLIFAIYKKLELYYVLAFVFGLLFTLGHLWCTYLNGMAKFMGDNINLANVPRADIFKDNTRVVFMILLMFVAASGLLFMLRYISVFGEIGGAIRGSVKSFVGHFLAFITFVRGLFKTKDEVDSGGVTTETLYDNTQPSELVLNILAGIGGLILFAVFVIWIISLAKRPGKPKRTLNLIYSPYADDVEDLKPKEKERWHLFKNNNEKVRYKFKRFIKKNLKPNVPRGKTACELSSIAVHNLHSDVKALDKEDFKEGDFLASEEDVKYEKLTTLYNVARYSGRMVTNEEMKEITR